MLIIFGLIRKLFFAIDLCFYRWSASIYNASISFYDIDSLIDASDIIKRCMTIVYSFLAIYMFFRMAVSLIQMLVDPSLIDDKSKGAGKMILNIGITLVLIVVVPTGFKIAKDIQKTIIEEKVIEQAFYGSGTSTDELSTVGDRLALSTFSVFLYPTGSTNAEIKKNSSYTVWKNFFDASSTRTTEYTWDSSDITDELSKGSGEYNLKYWFPVSTIAAIFLLWTMLTLCLDVAYRSLKLLILEIISPIAIISYINPKSSKDGIFAKWLKETIGTYTSLFVRIAVYAFASVLLVEFAGSAIGEGQLVKKLIYVLAIVTLIKNGPKLIDKIFGTEVSKDSETKMFKSIFSGIGAAGVTGTVGGIAGAAVAKSAGMNAFKGFLTGAKKGVDAGYKSGVKGDMRGVINSSIGMGKDMRKEFNLPEKTPWWKESEESAVKAMYGVVNRSEGIKGDRVKELEANDGKLINEMIKGAPGAQTGYVISKNGYTLDLRNVDDSYITAAGIKDAIKKTQSGIAVNNSMGLKNAGTYNKEAMGNFDVTVAENILTEAKEELNIALSVDMATKTNYIRTRLRDVEHKTEDEINNILNTCNVDEKYSQYVVGDIQHKIDSTDTLTLAQLSNIVSKAKGDVGDIKEARERYEKNTDAGKYDKRRKDLYKAAKGEKELQKANANNGS